jgi:DNA-binding PadR family transcriptional regulator
MAKNIDGPTEQDDETITKKNRREIFDTKIWNAIVKNYEMIQGAQISNSFILLMVLNDATQPLSTTRISELISKRSKGQIYKISATVRDSLQYRLKREGYVEGVEVKDKSLYSITPKGKKLLEGWIAFLSAYS